MTDHYDELAFAYHDLQERHDRLVMVTRNLLVEIGEGTPKGRPLDILSRKTVEAVAKVL